MLQDVFLGLVSPAWPDLMGPDTLAGAFQEALPHSPSSRIAGHG